MTQQRPTGSETTPPYAPRSSRFGSEPPSVADDVDVWRYAIVELHARNDDDDLAAQTQGLSVLPSFETATEASFDRLLPQLSQDTLKGAIDELPKRLTIVIKAKGSHGKFLPD